MKNFCLLTAGRSGSTALIDALAGFKDILVPNKKIECIDNELFHPKNIGRYVRQYQEITGRPINDEIALAKAFFSSGKQYSYAGFKSMPERHKNLPDLIKKLNLKVITLTRNDIASTVASFIVAIDKGTWRRDGGEQVHKMVFGPHYAERALSHLRYIEKSYQQLKSLPDAIHLVYEEIVSSNFASEQLDEYFGRPVRLKKAGKPTQAATYVDNWHEFEAFIEKNSYSSS